MFFLSNMTGLEYILLHVQEPILYVIRKQHRHSNTQGKTIKNLLIYNVYRQARANPFLSKFEREHCKCPKTKAFSCNFSLMHFFFSCSSQILPSSRCWTFSCSECQNTPVWHWCLAIENISQTVAPNRVRLAIMVI